MDTIDIQLLRLLEADGRLSNKQLAAAVGIAPSSCLNRLRKLLGSTHTHGVGLRIQPSAFNIGVQAMLAINLRLHSHELFNSFFSYLRQLEEVHNLFHTAGTVDILVHVMTRDSEHLRKFVLEMISSRQEVSRCETSLIYQVETNPRLPCYVETQ